MSFNFKKIELNAFSQMVLGFLCLIFGTFDRIYIYKRYGDGVFHTKGVIAIWTGAWFLITGVIGGCASKPSQNTQMPKMGTINTYLGFSIVATVFAGVLLICYVIGVVIINLKSCRNVRYEYRCDFFNRCRYEDVSSTDSNCKRSVGLGSMIIIFAIFEFGVSIWASVCCCQGYNCCCCDTTPPQTQAQVVYLHTQGGPLAPYVMTQGPNGMPMAVPAVTGVPLNPIPNQAVSGQAATSSPYIPEAGGQVLMQSSPNAAVVAPPQQGVTTSSNQQLGINNTAASIECPPPAYMP